MLYYSKMQEINEIKQDFEQYLKDNLISTPVELDKCFSDYFSGVINALGSFGITISTEDFNIDEYRKFIKTKLYNN